METQERAILTHPAGEQPAVEVHAAIADTFAGRIHIEWDAAAPITPFGQLAFFIDYLKQAGLFDAWVADCPLSLTSPNAPSKRDLLGTVMLSVLAGHRRYAHITTLRCDAVNPHGHRVSTVWAEALEMRLHGSAPRPVCGVRGVRTVTWPSLRRPPWRRPRRSRRGDGRWQRATARPAPAACRATAGRSAAGWRNWPDPSRCGRGRRPRPATRPGRCAPPRRPNARAPRQPTP